MQSAKKRSSPFWRRATSLEKAAWQVSPFASGQLPRLRPALCSLLRRVKCSRCFTSGVPSLTGSSNFRAGTEHSNRGGPGRSALQLQREAARPHSSIAGPLRQGRPAPRSTPHNVARNVGGDDRHNAFPGQFFHEQIQKARIHQVQWRTSDQYFSPQCRPARVIDNFARLEIWGCASYWTDSKSLVWQACEHKHRSTSDWH